MLAMALLCGGSLGCSDDSPPIDPPDPEPSFVELAGAAQKGPLVLGATVDIIRLNPASLEPNGQLFSTSTVSGLGEFSVQNVPAGPAELRAQGFHFDERKGGVSTAPITLRGLVDMQPPYPTFMTSFVNALSHMATPRARALATGPNIATAIGQSESELRASLGVIETASIDVATTLDVLGSDNVSNAYLLAVSCMLMEAAWRAAPQSPDGALQLLLDNIASDLAADGMLDSSVATELAEARWRMNPAICTANLQMHVQDAGIATPLPNIFRAIDFDQDQVADSEDSDDDGDGVTDSNDIAIQAATSGHAQLVVDAGGLLWAWGANELGELGDGGTEARLTPLPGASLSSAFGDVVAVTTSHRFVAAAKTDGSVWAWGDGFGATPVQVAGLFNIVAVTGTFSTIGNDTVSAYDSIAALASDGSVWTFNNQGTVGQCNHPLVSNVAAISPGVPDGMTGMTLRKTDGSVWMMHDCSTVEQVMLPAPAVEVAGSFRFGLARNADGNVYHLDEVTMVTPLPLSNVVAVGVGFETGLAALADGSLHKIDGMGNIAALSSQASVTAIAMPLSPLPGDSDVRQALLLLSDGNVAALDIDADELTPIHIPR